MQAFELDRSIYLPCPLSQVFPFLADPTQQPLIAPPRLRMRFEGCNDRVLRTGSSFEFALRVRGLPLRWRTLVSSWHPPFEFVHEQVSGPFREWSHHYAFESIEGGTRVCERIRYVPPGGALFDRLFVRHELDSIFTYRAKRLSELFRGCDDIAFDWSSRGSFSGLEQA